MPDPADHAGPAAPLQEQRVGPISIVEISAGSLMDPPVLEAIKDRLIHLIDEQDRRKMVLNFEKVEYISSQMIGVLLAVRQRCEALPGGKLVLCGVGKSLMELLKLMKLHKLLTIKPTQREAVAHLGG
ncbi:MAG: STAS domain-containing protein [Planctomycetota bacterium]